MVLEGGEKKEQLIFYWSVVFMEIPADAPRLLAGDLDHHASFQPYHLSSVYLQVLECLKKEIRQSEFLHSGDFGVV